MLSRTFHGARLSRPVALFAAVLLAAFAVLVTASSARAHDELLGSDPAANATVDALPGEITLTFSGVIAGDAGASEVQATDAAGTSLIDGEPTAQDNVLTQPLSGEASGAVTVLWKVVSSDGHPISGEFSFTVAGAPAPEPTETTEPSAAPEPTETTATPAPTATTTPAGDEDSSFGDVWPWVVFGILAAALLGAVAYLLLARARRGEEGGGTPPDAPGPGSEPPAAH